MRHIFLFMNVSLDGYFEDANHDISGFKNDFEAFSDQEGGPVDALLFGRKTYDGMKFWSTPQALDVQADVAKFMTETPKYVVTHSKSYDAGWENVTVFDEDAAAQVKKLKESVGESIAIFGSNNLCLTLMQAGLIDDFQIVVNPVAFGGGSPLFGGLLNKADFTLTKTRAFKSGAVLLSYKPV
jgi:dihydrofolate reductase